MTTEFKDIVDAFDFVSADSTRATRALLDKETGKTYLKSEFLDDDEEWPDDIDDEKYIEIPHKNDLNLGKKLVLNFAFEHSPNAVDEIEAIFRRKGAYSKFKTLLERKGIIEKWYEYELQAQERALREWCEFNEIEIHG